MSNYKELVEQIVKTYQNNYTKVVKTINVTMLETYWEIGRYIVTFEQEGKVKAEYGRKLIESLSKDLKSIHHQGFSVSNLRRMRQLYMRPCQFARHCRTN